MFYCNKLLRITTIVIQYIKETNISALLISLGLSVGLMCLGQQMMLRNLTSHLIIHYGRRRRRYDGDYLRNNNGHIFRLPIIENIEVNVVDDEPHLGDGKITINLFTFYI